MSLTPVVVTFALVAVVFVIAGMALGRWTDGPGDPEREDPAGSPAAPWWREALRAVWLPAAIEAAALTLLAALWFASLGHGGWPTLFLLLGAVAAGGDGWWRQRRLGVSRGDGLKLVAISLVKYLIAGGLCAWRLS
jgi:hypothetical protein